MSWILFVIASVFACSSVYLLIETASLSEKGDSERVIEAANETIRVILWAAIGGLSLYFWRSGLLAEMDWFFAIVSVYSFLWALLFHFIRIFQHGEVESIGPAAMAITALRNLAITVGFWYVYFVVAL